MKILVLDATTKKLQAVLSGAVATAQPEYVCAFADDDGSAFTEGASDGALNNTTAVDIVAAPASGSRRIVKSIGIYNKDTASVTVLLYYNDNGTQRTMLKKTLAAGEVYFSDVDTLSVDLSNYVTLDGSETLTNKTLTAPRIATLTPDGVQTITFPSATFTVVGVDTTDTLKHKTIDTVSTAGNVIKINGNTLSATAGTATVTIPNSSDTLVARATTDTLTNKRINPRTSTAAAGDISPALGTANVYQRTGLTAGITINAPTGTPVLGEVLVLLIKDNGTSRSLTWNATYKALGAALPTATTISKRLMVTCQYDGTDWLALSATEQ